MPNASPETRRRLESLDPADLAAHQLDRLNALLARNPAGECAFTRPSWPRSDCRSLRSISSPSCPTRSRKNCSAPPGAGGWAANLTWPRERYVRLSPDVGHARPAAGGARHGRRLAMVAGLLEPHPRRRRRDASGCCLLGVFVRPVRRLLERARRRARARLPGGSRRRHEHVWRGWNLLRSTRGDVVFCTPSYALHMAEVADERQIDVGRFACAC